MKICLIPNTNQPQHESMFYNGVIKHTHQLIDILHNEHDLYVVATNDSFLYKKNDIKYLVLDYPSNMNITDKDSEKSIRSKRTNNLKKIVNSIDFDIILTQNHYTSASTFKSPTICFIHHTFDNPVCGGTSMLNINMMYNMRRFLESGNTYIFVSDFQKKSFENGVHKISERLNKSLTLQKSFENYHENLKIPFDKTFVMLNSLELQYKEKEINENIRSDLIAIARCHPEKKLQDIINFANNNKLKLKIFCNTITDELKYKNKIEKLVQKSEYATIYFDIAYNEIMNNLKNSKAIVIASNESLSYVGMEALYFGVKVVYLNYKTALHEFKINNSVLEIKNINECIDSDKIFDFLNTKLNDTEINQYRVNVSPESYKNKLNHLMLEYKKKDINNEW